MRSSEQWLFWLQPEWAATRSSPLLSPLERALQYIPLWIAPHTATVWVDSPPPPPLLAAIAHHRTPPRSITGTARFPTHYWSGDVRHPHLRCFMHWLDKSWFWRSFPQPQQQIVSRWPTAISSERWVVKRCVGAHGDGVVCGTPAQLKKYFYQWQKPVLLEPYFSRCDDWSVLFDTTLPNPFCGATRMCCTTKGQWQKTTLMPLTAPLEKLVEPVLAHLLASGYRGKGSCDGFTTHTGQRRLSECNLRWTMGHVALALQRQYGGTTLTRCTTTGLDLLQGTNGYHLWWN